MLVLTPSPIKTQLKFNGISWLRLPLKERKKREKMKMMMMNLNNYTV